MPAHSQLRQLWTAAGYSSGMGSAAAVPPPNGEYLRVYHLTSATHAISSVALQRLKVARFSDLNDPFELLAVNFRDRDARRTTENFKNEINTNTGLICFSANWTDPVLWSHYGDKHRGVCLGFDIRRKALQKVLYEDERLLKELGSEANPTKLSKEMQRLLLTTKFKHWQYEQEHRMFVDLKTVRKEAGLYFKNFDNGMRLREVIIGPECAISSKAVRSLLKSIDSNAATFKSRLAFKFFSVVPKEYSIPPLDSTA